MVFFSALKKETKIVKGKKKTSKIKIMPSTEHTVRLQSDKHMT